MVNPPTLRRFAVDALLRNVPVLLGPLEIAARNDGSIDFEEFAMEYSLAVFGEIAFDASPQLIRFSRTDWWIRLTGNACPLPSHDHS